MSDPRLEYERRLNVWRARIAELDSSHLIISNARLFLFAVLVLVFWLAVASEALSAAWILLPALAFGVLLVVHARVLNRAERARRLGLSGSGGVRGWR